MPGVLRSVPAILRSAAAILWSIALLCSAPAILWSIALLRSAPLLTVLIMRVPETPPLAHRAGFSFWGHAVHRNRMAALCIGLEGETGDFKCLTPSALSPARPGLFFETPMSVRLN
jgi:hypothetical protein